MQPNDSRNGTNGTVVRKHVIDNVCKTFFTCIVGAAITGASAADRVLVLGISDYIEKPLLGVKFDRENAKRIAQRLGYAQTVTTTLGDADLSGQDFLNNLNRFGATVQRGDRVFIYYSGHGQSAQAANGQCVQGLVARDMTVVSHKQFLDAMVPISKQASEVTVILDACHSGGIAQSASRSGNTRQAQASSWTAKGYTPKDGKPCDAPSNIAAELTRSIRKATEEAGYASRLQNLVIVAAADADQWAIDDSNSGGLATRALLHCLDTGITASRGTAASVNDLVACSQKHVSGLVEAERKAFPNSRWIAPTINTSGNTARPLWAVTASSPPTPIEVVATAPSDAARFRTAVETLHQYEAGKNPIWDLRLVSPPTTLRLGSEFNLNYEAAQGGFFYILSASTDGKFAQIYPPEGEHRQRLAKAGLVGGDAPYGSGLPAKLEINGLEADNHFLVVVTKEKRDLTKIFDRGAAGRAPEVRVNRSSALKLASELNSPLRSASAGEGYAAVNELAGYGAAMFTVKGIR